MDFQQTSLPDHPTIRRAYALFQRQVEKEERPQEKAYLDTCLKMAQILGKHAPTERDAIVLALLSEWPHEAIPLLKKHFGPKTQALMEEMLGHAQADFTRIENGSNEAKLVTIAEGISHLAEFLKFVHDFQSKRLMAEFGADNGFDGDGDDPKTIRIPYLTNLPEHQHILKVLEGRTSSPSLEKAYHEAITGAEKVNEAQIAELEKMGISREKLTHLTPLSFPSFAETMLLDHPDVHAAYDLLARDPRATSLSASAALEAAEILSEAQLLKNSATVAAALLGIGIPHATKEDFKNWGLSVTEKVIGLLEEGTVYDRTTLQTIDEKSQGVKQIIAAFATFQFYSCENSAAQLLQMPADQNQQKGAAALNRIVQGMRHIAETVLGKTGDEALEQMLRESMTHASQKVQELLQNKNPGGPKPSPRSGTLR